MGDNLMPKAEETAEETTTTEETVDETATQETNPIDYDKELNESVEKFEKAEANREGYLKRKGKTEEAVDETVKQLDIEEEVAKALKKQLPKLQASLVEDNVETVLDQLASSDAERKLIRFHFENSVGLNGTIRERLENAKLIANKKTILKTNKEMAVALNNRQGLSTTGQGSSTEGMEVKDNFLSKEQLADLKARGWDDKKIQRFKDNLRK